MGLKALFRPAMRGRKMSIEDIKKSLNHIFKKDGRVLFAYLFGSTAKDEVAPLSDIDVAVYLSEGDPEGFFDTKLSLYADLCRIEESLRRS